jgi:transposase
MEATGDYWKPFYYLQEDLPGVEVMLVNARHVKNLPGRKTDVAGVSDGLCRSWWRKDRRA